MFFLAPLSPLPLSFFKSYDPETDTLEIVSSVEKELSSSFLLSESPLSPFLSA